jgi:DNA mismatch repair protein MutL
LDVTPWQSAGGTTIICDDIFFNVPVRQKFLKSAASEYGAVLELVQAIALSRPDLDLTLAHNGRETLRAIGITDLESARESVLRKRFAQVARADGDCELIYKESSSDWGSMTALLSAPGVERGSAKDMFIFVNGRWVRDKSLRFAVLRGYHSHLLRGKYPVVALFLTMDPALIDANVHPAKTEVRLQYAQEIHGMVAAAIRDGLRQAHWAAPAQPSYQADDSPDFPNITPRRESGVFAPAASRWSEPTSKPPVWKDVTPSFHGEIEPRKPRLESFASQGLFEAPAPARPSLESIPWGELCYMGSIADCYLMFSHGDRSSGARMLVLDQHAFHERVMYERLVRDRDLLSRGQPLLVPEAVMLSPAEVERLRDMREVLHSNGFRFEILSGEAIEVRSVPVILAKADIQGLFEAMAGHAGELVPMDDNAGLAHDLLSTIACHSAVRAGEPLGPQELKVLLNEARDVDFFHNCPHGRRVFRWWDESQIARWFDR